MQNNMQNNKIRSPVLFHIGVPQYERVISFFI
jgi:hypothetical protein